MVRFEKHALIIEIPIEDGDPVEYYEGLQNALYDVFWQVTTGKEHLQPRNGANWIAAYLGPAISELEPSAREVLKGLSQTPPEHRPLSASDYTDAQLLSLLTDLTASRFAWLMGQLEKPSKQ
ncbi:hypothetical protein DYU11_18410 [Fibrisoma montanum]|uniref:Uncharacterized protein n=1 Tax=Fibrisoma montanum TaxID=2305895 RepID=A0A418M5Z7_9BACT|nr:hypothetical protein [Fibrisoma montanum]RIV21379.1 hypothetical protein DYU11_18410 [Fibrisoma montanum]